VARRAPTDFDEHIAALEFYDNAAETIEPVKRRLRRKWSAVLGVDWCARLERRLAWSTQKPPIGVNIIEILRLWTYVKSLDLVEWGKMRYNLLAMRAIGSREMVSKITDEGNSGRAISKNPFASRIPGNSP